MTYCENERPGFQAVLQLEARAQHRKDVIKIYEPLASAFRQHQASDISHSRNIGAFSVAERLRD